jgi:hypothetical protein
LLEDGIQGVNSADYDEEIVNYWQYQYGDRKVYFQCISLIDDDDTNEFLLGEFDPPLYNVITHVLVGNDKQASTVQSWARAERVAVSFSKVLSLGELPDLRPPFPLTNADVCRIVRNSSKEEAFEHFARHTKLRVTLFYKRIGGKRVYFAWCQYPPSYYVKKGGHKLPLSPMEAYESVDRDRSIQRIYPEPVTRERLVERGGDTRLKQTSFTLSGLGSVGSYLLEGLLTLNPEKLILLDNDFLRVENIARHSLGLDYVHTLGQLATPKTDASELRIVRKNPHIQVIKKPINLVEALATETALFNTTDYNIFATGDINAERAAVALLQEGQIAKPSFFLWVEPYLAAGHMAYVTPDSSTQFAALFNGDVYEESVLEALPSELIFKNEPGCQTSFVPYAASDLYIYVSSMFAQLAQIVKTNDPVGKRFYWVGNLPHLLKKGIAAKPKYRSLHYGIVVQEKI